MRSAELPEALHGARDSAADVLTWSGTTFKENSTVITASVGAVLVATTITVCVNCLGRRKAKTLKKRKKPSGSKKKAKEAIAPIPDEPAAVPKTIKTKPSTPAKKTGQCLIWLPSQARVGQAVLTS